MADDLQDGGYLNLDDNADPSSCNPDMIEAFTCGDMNYAYQNVQEFYSAEMDKALEQANGAPSSVAPPASVALPRTSERLRTRQRHQQTPGC